MKFVTAYLIIVLLVGCAHTPKATVTVTGETVTFSGLITTESAAEFVAIAAAQTVRRLVIISDGGDVDGAIDMANAIFLKKIDVEVPDGCFSSCANYIFPAGYNKYITQRGRVAWHGNITHLRYLLRTGERSYNAEISQDINRMSVRENEFFRSIAVDGFLCWFAKIAPYNAKNLYLLSKEDMEAFGMTNLHVRSDYLNAEFMDQIRGREDQIRYVKVEWSQLSSIRPKN